MKLSHANYRDACNEAFAVNISNPTIFYNPVDGFYVAPSADLVPNDDTCIGLAYYSLNNNGARSFTGSRREYEPIARAIRKFYAPGFNAIETGEITDINCQGMVTGSDGPEPCHGDGWNNPCPICGYKNIPRKYRKTLTLGDLFESERQ